MLMIIFEQIFLLYFDAGGRSLLIGDCLENYWLATHAFSDYIDLLNQNCANNHCNFEFILQTAYNCFVKNDLKRLNSRSRDPPAKTARIMQKLSSKTLIEYCK